MLKTINMDKVRLSLQDWSLVFVACLYIVVGVFIFGEVTTLAIQTDIRPRNIMWATVVVTVILCKNGRRCVRLVHLSSCTLYNHEFYIFTGFDLNWYTFLTVVTLIVVSSKGRYKYLFYTISNNYKKLDLYNKLSILILNNIFFR